ncbi:hypothetical protein Avbf_18216 [Armadillidium vulgare]|nr:hypothetical protein Avbf_18216 [Armadillidium vulgare]
MDIKSEIEIKDEFLSPDFRYDGQSSEQDSWFDEIQEKDEIEIKDEQLDINEEYTEGGQHIDSVAVLDESQLFYILQG